MPPSNTTSSTENGVKSELRKVKVLVVKSVASSFRRIGLAFTREATHLDQTLLTTSQVNALKEDPNLSVTQATVVTADPAPVAGKPAQSIADAVVTPVQEPTDTSAPVTK